MWRFLGCVVLLFGAAVGLMYWLQWGPFRPEAKEEGDTPGLIANGEARLTGPMQNGVAAKTTSPLTELQPFKDPITLPNAVLTLVEEQEVSSRFPGQLREVLGDVGSTVRRGQLLGRLDDTVAQAVEDAAAMKARSQSGIKAALLKYETSRKIVDGDQRAGTAVSENDKDIHRFQMNSAHEEYFKALEERDIAEKELLKAKTERELHRIVASVNGKIAKVYKRQGESVDAGAPVFKIANYDRLRVEGAVPAQQAPFIRVGMRCLVEPERLLDPLSELRGHTGPINCLAVTPDRLLLASASDDQTCILWNWGRLQRWDTLHDDVPLYAVAAGKPVKNESTGETVYRFVTGGANGKVRLWLVTANAAGQRVAKKDVELTDANAHRGGAIRAVAFSPDGETIATGGDRTVCIWKIEGDAAKFQYKVEESGIEPAHRGTVTTLHLSADANGDLYLVSAGTDRALKRWKLGPKFAQLDYRQRDRTGDVPKLGVSADGERCLFDAGDKLWVVDFKERDLVGTIDSAGRGQFSALAMFTPSGQTVLTANSGGRVQLYSMPTRPADAAFFRQAYRDGFRRNSLLALGALSAGASEDLLLTLPGALATCVDQPKQAPAPEVSAATPVLSPAAHMHFPTLLVNAREFRGLTAVPEVWPLQGAELRHLVTQDASTVTCAAFVPEPAGYEGDTILFTGGADKLVRIWKLPPASERGNTLEGIVTAVSNQVESGTGLVRVRAELDNPTDEAARLYAGANVSLTVYPEMAPKR